MFLSFFPDWYKCFQAQPLGTVEAIVDTLADQFFFAHPSQPDSEDLVSGATATEPEFAVYLNSCGDIATWALTHPDASKWPHTRMG